MTANLSTPDAAIEAIGRLATRDSLDVYAVGGYVRDRQLGLPFSGEIDFSVVGDAPAFAERVASELGLKGKIQVYRRFGTASIRTGSIQLEFASSRAESYHEDSRNPDVTPAPFDQDLARRDFTINALAMDVCDPGTIIDHFNGLDDLKAGILRTPLDPEQTFRDDPLRILRAVRFAARLDFTIAEPTWESMQREAKRLEIVARERINDEFFKILAHNPPSRGLLLLHESGVLNVIFPEIEELAGVDQVGKHHHKDVLLHTFQVVDQLVGAYPDVPVNLRFAALLHDIGKPRTKKFEPKVGWTFHGHEHVGERMVRKMGKKYQFSEDLTRYTSHLVRLHMRPMNLQDEGVSDSAIRRLVVQAGDEIDDLLKMCRADITSGNARKVRRYLKEFDRMVDRMEEIEKKDVLRAFQSPIRGEEIMRRTDLPEGPRVGLIKALIEEAILDGEIHNSEEGANAIFERVVNEVQALDEKVVLTRLRDIMRARKDGLPPPTLEV
ncbi:CCA tRNA nucleotidyltransferase [bacterium]|nr:CCA tRNA nucleotidyltransferase [bacterium]